MIRTYSPAGSIMKDRDHLVVDEDGGVAGDVERPVDKDQRLIFVPPLLAGKEKKEKRRRKENQ